MKKMLVLMGLLCVTLSSAQAVEIKHTQPTKDVLTRQQMQEQMHEHMKKQRELAFERRLKLTELQKLNVRKIRQEGYEKIRPVMEQIKSKKQEAEMIRMSRMAVQMQEEKLTQIDKDLKELEKQAQTIRKENMKKFESILTWQQKRILREMKKEGRKNYRKNHPDKTMMFSSQNQLPPVKNNK